jgi:protein pelota
MKMKLLEKDFKKGKVKIKVTSLDDLWYLSHIIDNGDSVSGKTIRKIKLGEGTDRNVKIVKKVVFVTLSVEKIEFHKFSNSLRVSGKITAGPEDIARGSYHTFDVEEETIISLEKTEWLKFQRDKLNDAAKESNEKILIVALDREEVSFALLAASGYKMLTDIKGEMEKKGYELTKGTEFYVDVAKQIDEYASRFEVENIVLGSPAFWKEDLMNVVKKKFSHLVPMVTLATCNNTGKNGVEELLKRDEVKTVLRQDRTSQETALVEELFKEVSKQGLAAYGFKEVQSAQNAHAIKILLVTDDLIHEFREEGTYDKLDQLMKDIDRSQADVHIISTDHDAGKKLHGLGGVGAILRFKLN